MNATVAPAIDTKSFAGNYLLYRKVGGKNVRPGVNTRARNPRFRHPSFAAAEAEATRLLDLHPDSTFVILQEVGRVKLATIGTPAASPVPGAPSPALTRGN